MKKPCSRCKKSKLLSAYSNNIRTADGLQSHCRECHSLSQQARTARKKAKAAPKAKAEPKLNSVKNPIIFTANVDQATRLVRIANARQMPVEKLLKSFVDYALRVYRSSGAKLNQIAAAELAKHDAAAESEYTFHSTAAPRTFVDELSR